MNEGDEGPSVEVKEEKGKDGAEMKPSKENLHGTETAADSKPPGDKYSPKVSPEKSPVLFVLNYTPWYAYDSTTLSFCILTLFARATS